MNNDRKRIEEYRTTLSLGVAPIWTDQDINFLLAHIDKLEAALQHIVECHKRDSGRACPYDETLAVHLADVASEALGEGGEG